MLSHFVILIASFMAIFTIYFITYRLGRWRIRRYVRSYMQPSQMTALQEFLGTFYGDDIESSIVDFLASTPFSERRRHINSLIDIADGWRNDWQQVTAESTGQPFRERINWQKEGF